MDDSRGDMAHIKYCMPFFPLVLGTMFLFLVEMVTIEEEKQEQSNNCFIANTKHIKT